MPFTPKVGVGACYLSQDFPILGHPDDQYAVFSSMTSPSDQLRSYGVSFFATIFYRSERERELYGFSRRDASTDMQHDLPGSPRNLKRS